MSRAAYLLLLAPITCFAFSPTAALASGSSTDCAAAGGTYTKDGPNSICVFPETTKDVNGQALGTATTTTSTGQGNTDNKTTTACTGNTGQCKQL
jgi:hypothetical protein